MQRMNREQEAELDRLLHRYRESDPSLALSAQVEMQNYIDSLMNDAYRNGYCDYAKETLEEQLQPRSE